MNRLSTLTVHNSVGKSTTTAFQRFGLWCIRQRCRPASVRLHGHCKSAHNGQIDPKCPACRELFNKAVLA